MIEDMQTQKTKYTWLGLITLILCIPLIWTFRIWTVQHFLMYGMPYLNLDSVHLAFWPAFWGMVAFKLSFDNYELFTKKEEHDGAYIGLSHLAMSITCYGIVYAIL